MDSAFRPASVRPPFLTGTGALAEVALSAAATGAGAAAAFAALIAAQRFLVPAIIARLPAALIFRFAGAAGPTLSGGFESRASSLLSDLEEARLLRLACLARLRAERDVIGCHECEANIAEVIERMKEFEGHCATVPVCSRN